MASSHHLLVFLQSRLPISLYPVLRLIWLLGSYMVAAVEKMGELREASAPHEIHLYFLANRRLWLMDTLTPHNPFICARNIDEGTTGRFAQSGVTPCTEAREKQRNFSHRRAVRPSCHMRPWVFRTLNSARKFLSFGSTSSNRVVSFRLEAR